MSSTPEAPQLPLGAYDDRSRTVIGVVVFCLLFSTTMVGLRVWTRWKVINQMGYDDYFCILALIATYASGISIAHMTVYGLGKHVWVMNPANIPLYLRDFYFSIVFYCTALLFIKLAFLFQYYRVLAVQNMRVVYIVAMAVVGGWALSQVLVGIFICTPVHGFWDATANAKCIPNIPQWYINAAGNIITDVAVFALPLPALWKLQMPKQQRYLLVGIFSLGFFTVVISIIRIRYLRLFDDFPWENVAPSLWSIGELSSAITCSCLPTLRPFLARYFPALSTTVGRSTRGTPYAKSSKNGTGGVSQHRDPESGTQLSESKRGVSSSAADGSDVDLTGTAPNDSRNGLAAGGPFVDPRSPSMDGVSLESRNAGRIVLEPRQPGVGVRTSIGPARPEHTRERSLSGGVQVQRELYQVSYPRR